MVKVGPGYPIPESNPGDEPWSPKPGTEISYNPLQVQVGDYALFLGNQAIEIEFENKKYVVVPQSATLVVVREDFNLEE